MSPVSIKLVYFRQNYRSQTSSLRHAASGNKAFVKDVTQWAFQEKGVLRVVTASHHLRDTLESKPVYRIKDEVVSTQTLKALSFVHA